MFNIYYSRSNGVNDASVGERLQDFFMNLPNRLDINPKLTRHERGSTYDPDKVDAADILFVGIPDCTNHSPIIDKGCYTEIINAFNNDTPVIVLSRCEETHYMFVQQLTTGDAFVINKDDRQEHAQLDLWTTLQETQCSGGYGAYTHCDTTIQQMLYDIYSAKDYSRIFGPAPGYQDIRGAKDIVAQADAIITIHNPNSDNELLLLI